MKAILLIIMQYTKVKQCKNKFGTSSKKDLYESFAKHL